MSDPALEYFFAGTHISSTLALPELAPAAPGMPPRYRVDESASALLPPGVPDSRHEWRGPSGALTLTGLRFGGTRVLQLPGLAGARLEPDGHLTVWRDLAVGAASLRHAVVDQFLPRLLAGDGVLLLHGAAVVNHGERALVLLGESGFGKSTLAAALARGGARLLTDDCLRLDLDRERVHAIPSYSGVRLRPDSLAAVYGDAPPATTPVADYMDKRRVVLSAPVNPVGVSGVASAEVGTIVVLQPPGSTAVDVAITPLTIADASMAMVHHSFALDPTDMTWVRAHLSRAAEVAQTLSVHTLDYPRDYSRLPGVIERLRALATNGW